MVNSVHIITVSFGKNFECVEDVSYNINLANHLSYSNLSNSIKAKLQPALRVRDVKDSISKLL